MLLVWSSNLLGYNLSYHLAERGFRRGAVKNIQIFGYSAFPAATSMHQKIQVQYKRKYMHFPDHTLNSNLKKKKKKTRQKKTDLQRFNC